MTSGDTPPPSDMVDRLRAVAAAAVGVVSADRLDVLHDVLREQLRAVVPFDAFTFGLHDPETGLLRFEAGGDSDVERAESVIRAPIRTPDAVLGVISIQSNTPACYTPEDVELLEAIAALAATAILNIRHLEERRAAEAALRQAQRHAEHLAARLRVAADMSAGLIQAKSLKALQDVVGEACARVISFDYCTLGLYDPDTDSIRYERSVDLGRLVEGHRVLPLAGLPAERVVREKRSMLTLRSTDPDAQGALIVGTGRPSESVIRTPLLAGDRVLGLISVQSYTPDRYDQRDVEVLEAMAALAATAILNIEYLEEREELEAQLRQAQKMEAVGRLAGGVAHDFNNLLTAILGNTGLVLAGLADDDPSRPELQAVEGAAERAAELTRQLLAFGRRQVLLPRELDLNAQVEQVHELLARLLPPNVRLETRLDPRLGMVRADPGQIDQVLLNLVVNARDAMPDGGVIDLETRNHRVGDTDPTGHPALAPGSYVVLEIRDTGVGMDEPTLGSVFEPFFSTKPTGQGTGLGLATVYGIVKQSGGYVHAASTPGKGSVFTVYMPRIVDPSERSSARPPPGPAPNGTETVLLVEDEPAVRQLARRILERHGYRVVEADDGEAALRLLTEQPIQVDLLLTDVMMPRMGGLALAASLRASHPSLNVLFMSGYAGELLGEHGALADPDAFIPKPFTPQSLTAAVRAALDRPAPVIEPGR